MIILYKELKNANFFLKFKNIVYNLIKNENINTSSL